MANLAAQGSEQQNIIINHTRLSGVQNVSFQQNMQITPVALMGNDFGGTTLSGPTTTTVTIQKFLNNQEFIRTLTGSTTISGQFEYGTASNASGGRMNFNTAVIDGYAVSAQVNAIPDISYDMTIYGDLKYSNQSRVTAASGDNELNFIPETGIVVTGDDFIESINGFSFVAIQSVDFSEVFSFQPYYSVGAIGPSAPSSISLLGPIFQEATVVFEARVGPEAFSRALGGSFTGFEDKYIYESGSFDQNKVLDIKIHSETELLNEFNLTSGHLVSQSLVGAVSDTLTISHTYRGYKKV
tara:strand:- start:12020 stop:12913 length:894 start_codon:yes stop_codon:yes gene_type:complete